MKYIPYTLIIAIALTVLTGFIVDQGGQIETRQEAITIAQGAARAGTNAINGNAINGDAFQLAGPAAITAAQNYIHAAGPDTHGTVELRANQILVTVHRTYRTRLSAWIGITQIEATGTAAARLIDRDSPE